MSIGFFAGLNVDFIFNACKCSKFGFNNNAVIMSIFYNLFGQGNIFLKRLGGGVDHNRSKSAVDAGFAEFKRVTVVEMECDGNFGVQFYSCFNKLYQINMICIGACTF